MSETFSTLFETLEREFEQKRISRDAGTVLTRKERSDFSLGRLLRQMTSMGNDTKGPELDISDQYRSIGQYHCEGKTVLMESLVSRGEPGRVNRDMTVGSFGSAGALVATDVSKNIIDVLFNRTAALRLGVETLSGLTSNLLLPRNTSPIQLSAVPEVAAAVQSNPSFDAIALSPRRIATTWTVSRQLLLQTNDAIENHLRRSATKALSVLLDYFILNGQGSNSQPLGLLNTPGVSQSIFGGAPTWSNILSFEEALAKSNADTTGNLGWIISPATRNIWKQTPIQGIGQSSTYPLMIYKTGTEPGMGAVNGYTAICSNNILNDTVQFGNFSDALLAFWGPGPGAVEIIADPFSLATSAEIRFTLTCFVDFCLYHPQSFCVSLDSGAQ